MGIKLNFLMLQFLAIVFVLSVFSSPLPQYIAVEGGTLLCKIRVYVISVGIILVLLSLISKER